MAKAPLPSDATLFDVGSSLDAKIEYARVVLNSMSDCKADVDAEVFVRIDVTGSGASPGYWIVYDDASGHEQSCAAYQGAKAAPNKAPSAPETYSAKRVSIYDVRAQLRKFREAAKA